MNCVAAEVSEMVANICEAAESEHSASVLLNSCMDKNTVLRS